MNQQTIEARIKALKADIKIMKNCRGGNQVSWILERDRNLQRKLEHDNYRYSHGVKPGLRAIVRGVLNEQCLTRLKPRAVMVANRMLDELEAVILKYNNTIKRLSWEDGPCNKRHES